MEMIDKYTYRIQWSDDDEAFLASCLEFPSLMTHGDTQAEALDEMNNVLSFVLEDLSKKGKKAPEPLKERKFKGNISLRLPPETHEDLVYLATEQDLSLNQCITTIIEKNLHANTIMESVREMQNTITQLTSELNAVRKLNEELMKTVFTQKSTSTGLNIINPDSATFSNYNPEDEALVI